MTPNQRKNAQIIRNILTEIPPQPSSHPYQWRWGAYMIFSVCVTSIIVTALIVHG